MPDLWLMLGDNAYNTGTDAEYQSGVFDVYPSLLRGSALWPTLGNHDGASASSATQSGPYYDIFTLPTAAEAGGVGSGTEAYYAFDYGAVHFVCLDSYGSDRRSEGAMLQWLERDLSAAQADWPIAFWHHPPYSKGSHDSDVEVELRDMRQFALPVLEAHGVDLVLSGHSHSYERSALLDGHYGLSTTLDAAMIVDGGDGNPQGGGAYHKPSGLTPHRGAVYVVAGSAARTGGGPLDHPAMAVSRNELGSLLIDLDGATLRVRFLTDQGAVHDDFEIVKDAATTPTPTPIPKAPPMPTLHLDPIPAPLVVGGAQHADRNRLHPRLGGPAVRGHGRRDERFRAIRTRSTRRHVSALGPAGDGAARQRVRRRGGSQYRSGLHPIRGAGAVPRRQCDSQHPDSAQHWRRAAGPDGDRDTDGLRTDRAGPRRELRCAEAAAASTSRSSTCSPRPATWALWHRCRAGPSTALQIVVPAGAPTGPGSVQVVNAPVHRQRAVERRVGGRRRLPDDQRREPGGRHRNRARHGFLDGLGDQPLQLAGEWGGQPRRPAGRRQR